MTKKGRTNKTRVNISVDTELLEQAKTKLHLFGGKLSTLFNSYLSDFVRTMNEKTPGLHSSYKELEERIKKVEEKLKKS